MRIYSTTFTDGGEIPVKNTQEGEDLSPALIFEDIPEAAKTLLLIADDPDAPDPEAPKWLWLHWIVANLPADCRGFAEGQGTMPEGSVTGTNDCDVPGWSGPLPPIGVHRYFFHLLALDCVLDLPAGFRRSEAEAAIRGHVIAEAETMGTYIALKNR